MTSDHALFRHPTQRCPHCGRSVYTARNTERDEDSAPGDGDYMVCFRCFRVGIWTATGSVRLPDDLEAIEIAMNDVVQESIRAMRRFWSMQS